MPPFTKIFEYDSTSEKIFFSGLEVIKNRLLHNLRININETLMLYAAVIATELRSKKTISQIQKIVYSILSPDRVMIGVPESIRKISIEAKIDDLPKQTFTLDEPIPTSDYILNPN